MGITMDDYKNQGSGRKRPFQATVEAAVEADDESKAPKVDGDEDPSAERVRREAEAAEREQNQSLASGEGSSSPEGPVRLLMFVDLDSLLSGFSDEPVTSTINCDTGHSLVFSGGREIAEGSLERAAIRSFVDVNRGADADWLQNQLSAHTGLSVTVSLSAPSEL
jgi:hypothetical protein